MLDVQKFTEKRALVQIWDTSKGNNSNSKPFFSLSLSFAHCNITQQTSGHRDVISSLSQHEMEDENLYFWVSWMRFFEVTRFTSFQLLSNFSYILRRFDFNFISISDNVTGSYKILRSSTNSHDGFSSLRWWVHCHHKSLDISTWIRPWTRG